ncbi:hypothetical protein RJ639_009433 [Escallonia herrerae]|uniref:Uncharacterized protein n=1 Tax=Escallonia herrerae TaxID=1293975 RepID=A0AA89ASW9_9ASTE|nr:hypothetical protein RJ639_009433 [Escallonia herrerae]
MGDTATHGEVTVDPSHGRRSGARVAEVAQICTEFLATAVSPPWSDGQNGVEAAMVQRRSKGPILSPRANAPPNHKTPPTRLPSADVTATATNYAPLALVRVPTARAIQSPEEAPELPSAAPVDSSPTERAPTQEKPAWSGQALEPEQAEKREEPEEGRPGEAEEREEG